MEILKKANELLESGESVAIVTVVKAVGSTPRRAGSKMLVVSNGNTYGSIGGGLLEFEVIRESRDALRQGEGRLFHFDLFEKEGISEYAICGGSMDLYIDVIKPSERLIIFGGGHCGRALAEAANLLGLKVILVDDREDLQLNSEPYPSAEGIEVIIPDSFQEYLKDTNILSSDFVAIMTRAHELDRMILKKVLDCNPRFIGMIGSKKKVREVFEKLRAEGIPQEKLDPVYAPIGLDIGAETPEEIAVSVLAQLIGSKCNRLPDNLKWS